MSTYLIDYDRVRTQCETLLAVPFTATAWTATTAVSTNALRRPTTANGHYYRAMAAGTTGATQPTWPTGFLATVTDGQVTWRQEEPVTIVQSVPKTLTYPYLLVGSIGNIADIQRAIGNMPASELFVQVDVVAYQGAAQSKTWAQTRRQAYEILRQVQNVIRNAPVLGQDESNNFGVIRATSGLYTVIDDLLPVEFGLRQAWVIRLFSRA